MGVPVMEPLVSVDWLAEHLDDPDLRVFDATVQLTKVLFLLRPRSGEPEYRRGHVPGSGFLDLFRCTTRTGPAGR